MELIWNLPDFSVMEILYISNICQFHTSQFGYELEK